MSPEVLNLETTRTRSQKTWPVALASTMNCANRALLGRNSLFRLCNGLKNWESWLCAVAYCDKAYDSITDASGSQMVKLDMDLPKLGVLNINNMHTHAWEQSTSLPTFSQAERLAEKLRIPFA